MTARLAVSIAMLLTVAAAARGADDLAGGFEHPPLPARVRAYWWWLNGNVTNAAITKDLQWMSRSGMGGGLVYDAGVGSPGAGPVPAGPLYGSPKWRALLTHAAREADRLGLELTLSIQSGWNLGGPMLWSNPDRCAKHITFSEVQLQGPQSSAQALPIPMHVGEIYRDTFVLAYRDRSPAPVHRPIGDLHAKSAFVELSASAPDCSPMLEDIPATPGEEDTTASDVIDISSNMDAKGVLKWNVPQGTWTILRFGWTLNGSTVSTSSGDWKGPVLDYLDPDALRWYWGLVVDPILDEVKPFLGRSLKGFQTDSWEAGGLNWSARLPEEFRRRCGYDLKPYLPIIAGKIVDNRDVSNRFLADFRKVIGGCIADNHYAVFDELAQQRGMIIHCEASGPHAGPFDGQRNYSHVDWPMGEFWVQSPHRPTDESRYFAKCAASAAHVYGRPISCDESFTSIGPQWEDVLWQSQKPTFDHEACAGCNLVYWHAFTCSPAEMGMPGQEYFAGTHLDPQITWANQAYGFIGYLDRCSFLLQQGKFVADVCCYTGDHVPNIVPRKQADPAHVLPNYDYDQFGEDVLLTRMSVKDGRIVLPDGMSYRVMVLPPFRILSPAAIQKIRELVLTGATVIGPKPVRTATLVGYPASEAQLHHIADELWDSGKVIGDKSAKEVLSALGVPGDFESNDPTLDYVHRRTGDAEIYFVRNPNAAPVSTDCTFRVTGRQPEFWDAVTATRAPARVFDDKDGRTTLPLELPAFGSIFVVFRNAGGPGVATTRTVASASGNFPHPAKIAEVAGPWRVQFDPTWGGPARPVTFDQLVDWTKRLEDGIRYYSGTAVYRNQFDLPASSTGAAAAGSALYLDLGMVHEMAEVKLNGQNLGVSWCPPWRVDITHAVKPTGNALELDVVNLWPNRLIGDSKLPPRQRLTATNILKFSEPPKKGAKPKLLESGLVGPVTIESAP